MYCVNAWDRHYETFVDPEDYVREHDPELLKSEWPSKFRHMFEQWDKARTEVPLLEALLHFNSEDRVMKSHGLYLVDWFRTGEGEYYPGADQVTGWYNRNLRIFANIQRITESPDERILVIIGGGHLPNLRHCALASPEYELVELHEYL